VPCGSGPPSPVTQDRPEATINKIKMTNPQTYDRTRPALPRKRTSYSPPEPAVTITKYVAEPTTRLAGQG